MTRPFPLEAVPFAIPLAAPFRGIVQRCGVLVRGQAGWGEFAPFDDYTPDQDALWLAAAVEAAVLGPVGVPGLSMTTEEVDANAVLPDLEDGAAAPAAAALVRGTGCRVLKVKITGRGVREDLARIRTIHDAASRAVDRLTLRLDANGRLRVGEALALARELMDCGVPVDYFEQPCRTSGELRALRAAGIAVPVAADEAIRRDNEGERIAEFADVAVLKVAPLGGARRTLQLARRLPVPVIISGAAESSIGLSRDIAVAAALPNSPGPHGLGTGTLLADDLVAEPVVPRHGRVRPVAAQPDEAALSRAVDRLDPSAREQWLDRLLVAWHRALAAGLVSGPELALIGAGA